MKYKGMKYKGTIKKLGNTAAMKKRAASTRNAFARALYRSNKMIENGNSFYKNKLSMKEFKKEYEDFGKLTGMLKRKNLNKDLKTFVDYAISNRTPNQCESAASNLMKHLKNAVRVLNNSKGGVDNMTDDFNKKYIQILIDAGALKSMKNKKGKKIFYIIRERVPNKDDFQIVNDKYLKFKRLIIEKFGDQEYSEAYGS